MVAAVRRGCVPCSAVSYRGQMFARPPRQACCLVLLSLGSCSASSGPPAAPAPPPSAAPVASSEPPAVTPAASGELVPYEIRPDPESTKLCKRAYSRYSGSFDTFSWQRYREVTKEAIPEVRMRLSARSSGTYGGGSMVAWLMEDGRVFLPEGTFRPDRARYAFPACRIDPEAMRRFEERLRAPIVLFFPRSSEPLDIPAEERIVVENFFLLPSSIRNEARDDRVPLCFSDPEMLRHREAKTMRSQRISVWMGGKGHEIELWNGSYDGLMEYLVEPLKGCKKLELARKSALYAASD
jgi:hypothetical protein